MYIYKGNVQRHGAFKGYCSGLLAIAEQKGFAGQNGQRNRRARPHYRLLVAILKSPPSPLTDLVDYMMIELTDQNVYSGRHIPRRRLMCQRSFLIIRYEA